MWLILRGNCFWWVAHSVRTVFFLLWKYFSGNSFNYSNSSHENPHKCDSMNFFLSEAHVCVCVCAHVHPCRHTTACLLQVVSLHYMGLWDQIQVVISVVRWLHSLSHLKGPHVKSSDRPTRKCQQNSAISTTPIFRIHVMERERVNSVCFRSDFL